MSEKITLQQIADKLGVGKATVCRALKDHPNVSEATRQLVKKTAVTMGYTKDPAISNMAHYRWPNRLSSQSLVIAAIASKRYEASFPEIRYRSAHAMADVLGYRVDEFYLSDYPNPMRLHGILSSRGIQGLLIGPLYGEQLPCAFWDNFTSVLYGQSWFKPPLHEVLPDHFMGVRKAISEIRKCGYKNIGLLLDRPLLADDNDLRLGAFLMETTGPSSTMKGHVLRGDNVPPEKLRTWITRNKLELVICLSHENLKLLQLAGYSVPDQIGFVSLNVPNDNPSSPAMAGLNLQPDVVGRASVTLLDSLLRQNEKGIPNHQIRLLIEPCWISGPTIHALHT
ncbi:MAG: LacI family DNA-binding transcriptional regulator [Verrucomicrobiota bacterium]|nr:LacI family DNA-binding transcriptional regulator [Verrucomicrobiota bacterium]